MKSATVMPLASLMLLLKGEGMMGDIPVSLRSDQGEHCGRSTTQLWNIAGESAGLSGRTIRKLPFLALASLDTSGKRDFCQYSFLRISVMLLLAGLRIGIRIRIQGKNDPQK